MKRLAIVLCVLAVIVGGAVFYVTSALESRSAEREARALASLPLRALAPMLELEGGAPDLVVFEDGTDGWFEVDTATLPRNLEIGFHGPRIFDVMTGNAHVPLYCSGEGKIIWIVRDGQIARDFAFCSSRRMDLSSLRPFSDQVDLITEQRTRDEIEALIPALASDPFRALVAQPDTMSRYSQRIVLTPPLMWFIYSAGPSQQQVEAAIAATIQAQMGDVGVTFHRRPDTNPNLALPPGERGGGGGANMAMQQDGGYIVIPGVWAEPYDIWIECNPEACARAQTLDLADIYAQGRDFGGLRRAIATVTVAPRIDAPSPIEDFPNMADLEDEAVTIAAPVPVTYQIRYIERP